MIYKAGDIVKCYNEVCKVIHTTHTPGKSLLVIILNPFGGIAPEWKLVRKLAMTVDVHTYNTILLPYEECWALWVTPDQVQNLDPNILKPYTLEQLISQLENDITSI